MRPGTTGAEFAPMVQILDDPVPQIVDQMEDVLKIVDISAPVQVIEVPRITCTIRPSRAVLAATQMVEQLVEVPLPRR